MMTMGDWYRVGETLQACCSAEDILIAKAHQQHFLALKYRAHQQFDGASSWDLQHDHSGEQ